VAASQSPLFLVFLFLGLWIAAFAWFRRLWHRTQAGREWREYTERLSRTARRRAVSFQWVFLIVVGVAVMLMAVNVRHVFHPDEKPGEASPLAVALIVVSSFMIASYIAAWLTNVVWWVTPSMRNASAAAKAGLSAVNRRSGVTLLLLQGTIVIPICLVQIYLGSVMQ
jgi:nicotinamide riboside transporter PnuC